MPVKKLTLAHKKLWFTLKEAAEYLSLVFDETVTEKDIVQFAFDDQIKISYLARQLMVTRLQQNNAVTSHFERRAQEFEEAYEQGLPAHTTDRNHGDLAAITKEVADYYLNQSNGAIDEASLAFKITIEPEQGIKFVGGVYSIKPTPNVKELMLDFIQGKEPINYDFLLLADGSSQVYVPDDKKWVVVDGGDNEYLVLKYRFETLTEEVDGRVLSITKKSYLSQCSTPPLPSEWIIQKKHLMQFEKSIGNDTEETLAGSTIAALPHMTKKLEALFEIMRQHWTDYDPNRLSKQNLIASEIDAAFGWQPSKSGEPSRNAQTLAAMIRPDGLSEADQRNKKRKLSDGTS